MRKLFVAVFAALALAACCGGAKAGEWTLMAGQAQFKAPNDGTYWNANQPNSMKLSPGALGVRWDSAQHSGWSVGAQYTYFGKVNVQAYAVTVDAPHPGGYYEGSGGKCVGKCAPLAEWHMNSETDGIAAILTRHFGNLSVGAGWSLIQVKTDGNVDHWEANPCRAAWNYHSNTALDHGPMVGVTYKTGKWSVYTQTWFLEGRGYRADDGKDELPPSAYGAGWQGLVMVGYTF